MPAIGRTVAVRMYNVGFGDAFLVTVRDGEQRWTLLVDCGVHPRGDARRLHDVVRTIIGDLAAESMDGVPRLDVIVATHHHADHIAGFEYDDWEDVVVGEVWVPFVEDAGDGDAQLLRVAQADTAVRLLGLLERRTMGVDPGAWPDELTAARWFAVNSSGNEIATDRLLGRNGHTFASTPFVRYLPTPEPEGSVLPTGVPGATVYVLGPPRDATLARSMMPPTRAGWLALDADTNLAEGADAPLFDPALYVVGPAEMGTVQHLTAGHQALRHLDRLDDDALLAAASILERSVNNTSLFFVLEVGDVRLLFPGDSQQESWEHVFADPDKVALISNVAFYKISHHGSQSGTPRHYIEDLLVDGADAMLSWGLVKRWADTIPSADLLEALVARHHRVTRADHPVVEAGRVAVHGDLWSEITFAAP